MFAMYGTGENAVPSGGIANSAMPGRQGKGPDLDPCAALRQAELNQKTVVEQTFDAANSSTPTGRQAPEYSSSLTSAAFCNLVEEV